MVSLNNSNLATIVFLVFIAIFVTWRRITSGLHGRLFKTSRLFTLPLLYLLLLLYFMGSFIGILNYIILVMLICCVGIVPGIIFGEQVIFFKKNNFLYYKRSPLIMIIWLSGFLIRIALEILYPSNLTAGFIVDSLLSFTLGMIIGESIKTMRKYNEFKNSPVSDL
ncbi:MAG: hypothetical protein QXZ44_02625 [Ferroplasma sp.]